MVRCTWDRTDDQAAEQTARPPAVRAGGRVLTQIAVLKSTKSQFSWVELADREAIEPRLLAAGQAVNLGSPDVPQLDIHAVRAALAEEQNGHSRRV